MKSITETEYQQIKEGILNYGLNIAFLKLFEYEEREHYEKCEMLTEGIKIFCKSINLQYTKLTPQDIEERYREYNMLGKNAQRNRIVYLNNFGNIFCRIYGNRIHEKIVKK